MFLYFKENNYINERSAMVEKEFRKNIAKNVKEFRKREGMNQKRFAEKLEMNYQNYFQMERGLYSPSLNKLMKICQTLQITPNDLLLDQLRNEEIEKKEVSCFIKYEVRPVVCDYGVFENGQLILILNSSLNAELVKEILQLDCQKEVFEKICVEKEKKK